MFAKNFNSTKLGQISVLRTISEDLQPELRIHFKPGDFKVQTIKFSYSNNTAADKAFNNIDLELAEEMVRGYQCPVSELIEKL